MDISEFAEKFKEKGIFDNMEDLFAAFEAKMNPKNTKVALEKKSFLGQQHKQEFNICLQPLHKDSDMEVVLKILRCSPEIMNKPKIMELLGKPELCEIPNTLGKNLEPYSTEWNSKGAISKPDKDPEELARADRIYLETIYNLNHYWRSRMRVLNIITTFKEDYEIVNRQLDLVEEASRRIEESDSLKSLFEVILLLGNYMNSDNKKAFGFRLSTLQRLNFLKNQSNSMSFLQFMEKLVRKDFPEIQRFVEDLQPAKNASKISIEHLDKDSVGLIMSVSNIDSSLSSGNLSNPGIFHPEDKFLKVVFRELPEMRRSAEKLENKKLIVLERFNNVMKYFKEDPDADEFARNTFFKKFADFVDSYEKISKENIAQEDVQRRMEEAERVNEENQKRKEERIHNANIDLEKSIDMLKKSGLPERRNRLKELIVTSINSATASSASIEGAEEEIGNGITATADTSTTAESTEAGVIGAESDALKNYEIEFDDVISATGVDVNLHVEDIDAGLPDMLSERLKKRLREGSRRNSGV
jgi:cytokinesis protein